MPFAPGIYCRALLLIYAPLVAAKRVKQVTRDSAQVSLTLAQVNKWAAGKVMWTDVSAGVVKMPDDISHAPTPLLPPLLPADRCSADVRCRARGGGGSAAVAADHRQLPAVQPAQAVALRRPIHQPHQRGKWRGGSKSQQANQTLSGLQVHCEKLYHLVVRLQTAALNHPSSL